MAFQEAVKAVLKKIGLTDFDVIVPYIEGIVSDNTTSRAEKLESLDEFLGMAKVQQALAIVDEFWQGGPVKESGEELLAAWDAQPAKKQAERPVKQRDVIAELKSEMQMLQVDAPEKKPLTKEEKEEKKKKELLLQRFAYDVAETDANGDILLPVESKDNPTSGLIANNNAAAIADADRQKREKSKVDHERKVAKDKEMQAKQLADKDKAKKRTQKQERRGRGY